MALCRFVARRSLLPRDFPLHTCRSFVPPFPAPPRASAAPCAHAKDGDGPSDVGAALRLAVLDDCAARRGRGERDCGALRVLSQVQGRQVGRQSVGARAAACVRASRPCARHVRVGFVRRRGLRRGRGAVAVRARFSSAHPRPSPRGPISPFLSAAAASPLPPTLTFSRPWTPPMPCVRARLCARASAVAGCGVRPATAARSLAAPRSAAAEVQVEHQAAQHPVPHHQEGVGAALADADQGQGPRKGPGDD